jgi:hypothetical protein
MSKLTKALFPKSTHAVLSTLFMQADGLHLRGLMSATGLGSASAQRESTRRHGVCSPMLMTYAMALSTKAATR